MLQPKQHSCCGSYDLATVKVEAVVNTCRKTNHLLLRSLAPLTVTFPARWFPGQRRSHIWVPRSVLRRSSHLWEVSTGHSHDGSMHSHHGHPVRALQDPPLHRAVELPAQVSLLQQLLFRQSGSGNWVLGGQQQGLSLQRRLLLGQRLLYQALRVRARTRCSNQR